VGTQDAFETLSSADLRANYDTTYAPASSMMEQIEGDDLFKSYVQLKKYAKSMDLFNRMAELELEHNIPKGTLRFKEGEECQVRSEPPICLGVGDVPSRWLAPFSTPITPYCSWQGVGCGPFVDLTPITRPRRRAFLCLGHAAIHECSHECSGGGRCCEVVAHVYAQRWREMQRERWTRHPSRRSVCVCVGLLCYAAEGRNARSIQAAGPRLGVALARRATLDRWRRRNPAVVEALMGGCACKRMPRAPNHVCVRWWRSNPGHDFYCDKATGRTCWERPPGLQDPPWYGLTDTRHTAGAHAGESETAA
jgi:hypothetical protein